MPSQFFAVFDSLIAVRTHPGAQKSISGHFRADNDADDDDDRRINRLLYPLLRMRTRGKNISVTKVHSWVMIIEFVLLG